MSEDPHSVMLSSALIRLDEARQLVGHAGLAEKEAEFIGSLLTIAGRAIGDNLEIVPFPSS